ncbi:hypothetical protein [Actinocatenispora comari]|uniref:Uncharacterized protein n=1 Tax=Actinocatenispora comari TaxID=2807577 RepID=A0A8J4AEF8_9ACTN|nr:hypothetical protein [Actinocatenispora comari]GIL29160.1 hypothetical protein NUM_44140 [Actinocatenispora comari]
MRIGIGFGVGPFRVSQTLFRTRSRRQHRKVVHRRPGQHSGWWWCGVILAWTCAYPFLGAYYIGRWGLRKHREQQAALARQQPRPVQPPAPVPPAGWATVPPAYRPAPPPMQVPPQPSSAPSPHYPPMPGAYGTGGAVDIR